MLDLNELDTDDILGVDRPKGNDLAKAAAVCLESQKHVPGVSLTVTGMSNKKYSLTWSWVSAQGRRTRADMQEATEDGASGVAILLAIRDIGQTIILRSRKPTGIDYWLGDHGPDFTEAERRMTDQLQSFLEGDDLIVKGRLEVTGILHGSEQDVEARRRKKQRQVRRSDSSGLPAYVIVVEFGQPLAEVTRG